MLYILNVYSDICQLFLNTVKDKKQTKKLPGDFDAIGHTLKILT